MNPRSCGVIFKKIVLAKVNAHIPKFTIKSEYQPPWFDSECYAKCREKDKLHKIYKTKKSVTSELKFKTARREFKTVIKSKMRANLYSDDRNILHKKFWSHVKSATKSTRIPEVVSYGGKAASEPIEKAKLFNDYFRDSFRMLLITVSTLIFRMTVALTSIFQNLELNPYLARWMQIKLRALTVLMGQFLNTALIH